MKEFFLRAFRLTFAGALHNQLCEPRSIRLRPKHSNFHEALANPLTFVEVSGRLPLREHGETGETLVGIQILVKPDWMESLPFVLTDAPFLRRELDWHVPKGNALCYCMDQEWRWKLAELWDNSNSSVAFINFSGAWCLRNVDSLVTRHLHGHRYGISKWPSRWGQWSHFEKGLQEFEEFLNRQRAA